ncbi:MAG TPA: PBP1A family penicillin-binding protein [Pyrinomonadaceae bacterium]|nr:PBP1A family penicillin-binding protein [Pyrinomonadaceae bacterium]
MAAKPPFDRLRAYRPTAIVNAPPGERKHILRRFWFPAVLLLALAAGGLTGIIAAYQLNYSQAANEVAALATYRPSVVTRIYADDGKTVIGEFALEKRIPLKYEEIPPNVKNAILAVEDARFYDHMGIDPIRIIGAAWKNLTSDRVEGGSTLTQQLAKNLFLTREQTYKRKMNEWLLALQIERYYTKNQIMELYANHIFVGANAYGVEAGAETYFGKQAKDLTLEEAALLAAIPKAPGEYSPTANPAKAKERRDLVLDLMAKNGFASEAEVAAAKAKPIQLADSAYYQPPQATEPAFDYPVEYIRQDLEDKFTTRVAQTGLSVYSTINIAAQRKAYEVVRAGLRRYAAGHSAWHTSYEAIATSSNSGTPTQQELAGYKYPDWYRNDYVPGRYLKGLVMKVDSARDEATVRFGNYTATVNAGDMGGKRSPRGEFKAGYLAEFIIREVDKKNHRLRVELQPIPAVEGALMTLNAHTGEIMAMQGGYDFLSNKFNNAVQAYRQTGSAFKPFIYTAAIEWGMTPDSIVSGAPISIGGWTPHNYDGSLSCGDMPLKTALAQSMNIPAVHLLQTVGIQTGAQMVRRFGIKVPMAPYLPSALGATEVPLDQMVSAYSAFPNKGVRVEPHMVRKVVDRDGAVMEEWEKTTYKVVNEYVALTMVSMMRGVVQGGTASAAGVLGVPLAGKTGTVNDHTDVWFLGYTPTYVTGVWMGYPGRKKNLGNEMTGAHGALPFFIDYMKDFLKDKPKEDFPKAPSMPEDMREMFKQRQRELALERAQMEPEASPSPGDENTTPSAITTPKLEDTTLPPAPKVDQPREPSTETPKPQAAPVETPPRQETRPREAEPAKKKGKKGEPDGPPN